MIFMSQTLTDDFWGLHKNNLPKLKISGSLK